MNSKASPKKTSAVAVSSAKQLLQEVGVDLEGIVFYRVSGEVAEDFKGSPPKEFDVEPEYSLLVRHEGAEIGVRLRTELRTIMGVLTVDVAVNYAAHQVVEIEPQALADFANDVGVMALLPYIREAIASLSQRVFVRTITMPIYQRGDLVFMTSDPPESEAVPK